MTIKRNLIRDILRDTNSKKYSMTKVAALTSLILLVTAVMSGIVIMIIEKKPDYILIGELIALLLTLLGFKNVGKKKPNEEPNKITQAIENIKDNDILNPEENDELG